MTCIYDKEKFQEFRKLAITDAKDLEIGKTYYGNWIGAKTLKYVLTYRGLDGFRGTNYYADQETDDLRWMVFTDGEYVSLWDHNIGASYNPWMIFDSEEVAERCRKELPVEIRREDWGSY